MPNKQPMKGALDRFEGVWAVIEREDKTIINVPRQNIDAAVHEGDRIVRLAQSYWVKDENETTRQKDKIQKLSHELWSDSKNP